MASRTLYEIIGFACGFVLIDYGFNFMATGLPGARSFTSQFIGANLLVGGSAAVFISLFYMLRSDNVPSSAIPQIAVIVPDVRVETVVEEQTPPKSGFYRNIEYTGYVFTAIGLFSAADLILQVFIPSLYNEGRWWTEILLATFGVLSYTIFTSVGRFGAKEETELAAQTQTQQATLTESQAPIPEAAKPSPPSYAESLEVHLSEFQVLSTGDYEQHLAANVFDKIRIEAETVTIWREDRQGIRSIYLAGPYELKRKLMESYVERGEDLKIGYLSLSVETIRDLLALQQKPV